MLVTIQVYIMYKSYYLLFFLFFFDKTICVSVLGLSL
jgi:hypothetical protein